MEGVWRRGGETFVEVVLPEGGRGGVGGFGVHPALLDAALHAVVLGGVVPGLEVGVPVLPFVWSGVRLFAVGAVRVRVRISGVGGGGLRLDVVDGVGDPVVVVEGLRLRPLPLGELVVGSRV
ncbi:polyketide synthase dehydratase domain-containing protein, partial [Streptomyces sp. HSW2009]|uniref:polyketide synthase dehydratase domain-containing protein n=1 Tax=Streptomyces sp. HSW2009 TaxID=3142890 RepID=UPI0032EF68F2